MSGGRPSVPADGFGGDIPCSASGLLEPYGTRITIQPTSQNLDPEQFLVTLLEDLAAGCLASGASVIGHLKCLFHMPGSVLVCNLTSMRSGATCTGQMQSSGGTLAAGSGRRRVPGSDRSGVRPAGRKDRHAAPRKSRPAVGPARRDLVASPRSANRRPKLHRRRTTRGLTAPLLRRCGRPKIMARAVVLAKAAQGR